jgi:DNA-binding XRE family transcriptional regulator
MPKSVGKMTPGQELWFALYRAEHYDEQAKGIAVPPGSPKCNPERATRQWLQGMSRHLKRTFPTKLRMLREKLGMTQQQLAAKAELTVTAVAMIERSERVPNIDTAARLCWALDMSAGVSPDNLN